ncbi:hypothetical protein [Lichenifustis flavocetrariae]|uniref:Uncharacterized protein n=1 Tax=Lichenifustis flavocetrariae TaxID=2949735 RepID=A0AA42CMX1_9HYPH|nr:hypothetical protein [Lichenifustis flavocetrariae]MCW6508822.1 hypothetical protein [Lichenifustis flavocetrariae]
MSAGRRIAAAVVLVLVFRDVVPPARAEGDLNGSANPMRAISKDHLSGFRQRPLFNPARAEPPAPAAVPEPVAPASAPPPPQEPPPPIHLVGIINGAQNLAIIRLETGGKTSVVSTGDRIGAWTVTVLPTGLRLRNDQRNADFALFAHAAKPPGDPPP